MNLEINWANAQIECEGSTRPDGSGIRLSFAGPPRSDGRRTRIVFGIRSAAEGRSGRSLPTNVTVMFEGEARLFATRGDDRCTVDKLEQERIGALGGPSRSYRVVGSGFCTEPASDLKGEERIFLSRFDFAGRTTFEDDVAALDTFPRASVEIEQRKPAPPLRGLAGRHPAASAAGTDVHQRVTRGPRDAVHRAQPRVVSMWMKNTYIPLDMLFIDPAGRIVRIAPMTEPHSLTTISSGVAAVWPCWN